MIAPSNGTLYGGSTTQTDFDAFEGLTGGPKTFGDGNQTFADSGSGSFLGVSNGFLILPEGYISGTALADTATFAGATFASLGYTPSTYTYTLPSGDTLTINSVVREPSTCALLGVGAVSVGVVAMRRRQRII